MPAHRQRRLFDLARARRLPPVVVALALPLLFAGCSGDQPAYVMLQNSIRSTIQKDDGRRVDSVACAPHVQDVSYSDGYVHLSCLIHFGDGSSYTTAATIEARAYQVAGYNFEWDSPGPQDITTAPLPQPTATLAANSPTSLLYARNLRPVVSALAARFGSSPLILSMALYPGELIAVVGANGSAQLVTVHPGGALTVGPQTTFEGTRSGILISQLNPAVPQRLAELIAARGGVPLSGLRRFVLTSRGDIAGWNIEPASAAGVSFRAHVTGDALQRVEGGRAQPIG